MERTNRKPFVLSGRWYDQLQSLIALSWSSCIIPLRRLFFGPRRPGWTMGFEMANHFLKYQTRRAFDMADMARGREYEDSLVFYSPAREQVTIEPVHGQVRGDWYRPVSGGEDVTLLYLHGGGYASYPRAYRNVVALVTLAARSRTFALDYRLIPEHPFPAQLDDALAAYRWLLETGTDPLNLVVAGDSAGGNLLLALLLSLRDSGMPLPALGVGICPWTDVGNGGESMTRNEPFDWVEKAMAVRWAQWLCRDADVRNPTVSPVRADLKGLPPIYIQAGEAEILFDMIRAFADRAHEQGADVRLDGWKNMNHDFQAYGDMIPEAREALNRIGQVIGATIGARSRRIESPVNR
jgi:epsilon-lactone hydrolase